MVNLLTTGIESDVISMFLLVAHFKDFIQKLVMLSKVSNCALVLYLLIK